MQLDPLKMIADHAASLGVSPYRLLRLADVDPSSWSKWQTGPRMPKVTTLNKILAVEQPRRERGAE